MHKVACVPLNASPAYPRLASFLPFLRQHCADGSSEVELNPVLAFQAKEHRKSTAKAARERLLEGRKTGGLRRLMPNARHDDAPTTEVLIDRYIESSEGGGVRALTSKGGGVATLSNHSSAAASLELRRHSQVQHRLVAQRRLTKVRDARDLMLGTAEEGGHDGEGGDEGGSGGADPLEGDASAQHPSAAATTNAKEKAEEVWEGEMEGEEEETKETADARMARRLAEAKAQQEEERERTADAKAVAREGERRRPLRVSVGQIGFAALKSIVVERGVPKDQADGCMSKQALRELARRFEEEGEEALASIEWAEEGEESGDTVLV